VLQCPIAGDATAMKYFKFMETSIDKMKKIHQKVIGYVHNVTDEYLTPVS